MPNSDKLLEIYAEYAKVACTSSEENQIEHVKTYARNVLNVDLTDSEAMRIVSAYLDEQLTNQ